MNGSFPLTKTKMPGINTPIATTQCSRANQNIFPEPAHTSSLALHTQLNISHLAHPHPIDRRLEAAKSRGPQIRLYRCRGLRGQLCMAKVQVLARLCHCHQGHFGLLCRSVVRFLTRDRPCRLVLLHLFFSNSLLTNISLLLISQDGSQLARFTKVEQQTRSRRRQDSVG